MDYATIEVTIRGRKIKVVLKPGQKCEIEHGEDRESATVHLKGPGRPIPPFDYPWYPTFNIGISPEGQSGGKDVFAGSLSDPGGEFEIYLGDNQCRVSPSEMTIWD